MRTWVLLAISIVAGLLAWLLFTQHVKSVEKDLFEDGKKRPVCAVRNNLLSGERVTENDIAPYEFFEKDIIGPDDDPINVVLWEHRNRVLGKRLAVDLRRGMTLRMDDFAVGRRGGGQLAYTINREHNHRALSVAVSQTSSVTNLIQPNDHVDIISSFRFPQNQGQSDIETMTVTLLQNVTVLATGQRYYRGGRQTRGKGRQGYSTLTLSVTPKEAELLVFAQLKGELTFTLRHPEDVYIENKVQDVTFRYLRDNYKEYTQERKDQLELQDKFRIRDE